MIEITNYKPVNKGCVVGTLNFNLETVVNGKKLKFFYNEVTLFQKNGHRWLNFASRTYEKDGEKKYYPYCGVWGKDDMNWLQEIVIKFLDKYFIDRAKQAESKQEMPPMEMFHGTGAKIEVNDNVPF